MKHFKCWPPFNPRSLNYPEIPVYQFLRSSAAKWPFRIAMIFDAMEITYSELLALSERFAAALASLGIRKGDRVAIHLPNSPPFAVAYYAAMMNGAIFTPCSPLMVERELEYQMNDAGAETIITLDLFYPTVEKVVPKTKIKNVIVASIPDIFPPFLASIRPPLVKKEFPGTATFALTMTFGALEVGYPTFGRAAGADSWGPVLIAVNSTGSAVAGLLYGGLAIRTPLKRLLAVLMGAMAVPIALHLPVDSPWLLAPFAFAAGRADRAGDDDRLAADLDALACALRHGGVHLVVGDRHRHRRRHGDRRHSGRAPRPERSVAFAVATALAGSAIALLLRQR